MAEKPVESMSGKWEPKKYRDGYRDALMKWIEKKAKQGELAVPPGGKRKWQPKGPRLWTSWACCRRAFAKRASKPSRRRCEGGKPFPRARK